LYFLFGEGLGAVQQIW